MPKAARELTPLEMLLLSTLVERERYGLEIRASAAQMGQRVSLASLYTALARLEGDGFVTARWGDTNEARRGARRRYYTLTGLGQQALRQTRQALQKVLRRIPAAGLVPTPEAVS